jgi:hypothetical protein
MKISYHPINVWINFIIILCFYITPIFIVLFMVPKPSGLIFTVLLLIIAGKPSFMIIKSFFRFLNKKPAIELTEEYYIDHLNMVKIRWSNITNVGSNNFGQWTFLSFDLVDKSIFYQQIQNPIQKLLLKLETFLTKISMKTNISLVDGNNKEIYWTVYNYHKNAKK